MIETAQSLTELHPKLAASVAEAAERLDVPGVAVGIRHGDDVDFVFHGVTSVDNPLEVNERTHFQIGSTTKTYTATAAMILVDQGRLSLEAKVREYVPELKLQDADVAERVTVLHLLNHTAGWVGDVFTDTGEGEDFLEKFVAGLNEVEQLSPLGGIASYNNAAFALAGLVVQRVAGKPYEEAVKELVLEPLGMKDSFYNPREALTKRFAVGHVERDGVQRVATPWALPRSANPAGGIISTVADQLIYAGFHLGDGTAENGRRILKRETLARMQVPTAPLQGGALGEDVGISWLLRHVGGARVVAHGGTTNGQLSAFELVPEKRFGLTILTNSGSGSLLHREVSAWILEAYLGLSDPEEEQLELDPADLEAYAGEFDSRTSIVEISVDGTHLVLRSRYTEEGKKQALTVLGEVPPEPKPMSARLLSGDRYVILDGDAKGMKGGLVRDDAGYLTAIELGGRLAHRVR